MAYAYAYTEGVSHPPDEIILSGYIDRYGAEAVTGEQVLSSGLLRSIRVAENIAAAHQNRSQAKDFGAWAISHPDEANLLNQALMAAVEKGLICQM